jgi:hypothetical protein
MCVSYKAGHLASLDSNLDGIYGEKHTKYLLINQHARALIYATQGETGY